MRKNHLLVLNYVMDEEDQLLSHQAEIVNLIAKEFDHISVLTGRIGKITIPSNVTLKSYNWVKGKKISNVFNLIKSYILIKKNNDITIIFSHMTFMQSLLILPFTKFQRIKHYLWYAHKSKNIYLQISSRLFDGLITSTRDSCPIKNGNVYPIGQTINSDKFTPKDLIDYPIIKLVHIGRFDPIKNVSEIIRVVEKSRVYFPNLTLDIIGSASSISSTKYEQDVKSQFVHAVTQGWLKFFPGVSRKEIPYILEKSHAFIHSCNAALDKVILEANFSNVPVITSNEEFIKSFGSWTENTNVKRIDLLAELNTALNTPKTELEKIVNQRYQKTFANHELKGWTTRLLKVINS
jgi:glycosyltransferase involved in cell wall biosynthesis